MTFTHILHDSRLPVYDGEPWRELPLSQGLVTLIDAEDYEKVGCFKWSARREVFRNGIKWYARRNVKINGKRTTVLLHRVILGVSPEVDVDHWNNDGLDNRRSNIRVCTCGQNNANATKRVGTTSRFKGVCWDSKAKQWVAQIRVNHKKVRIGYFTNEEQAALAYNDRAHGLWGAFARLNVLAAEDRAVQ